MRDNREKLQNIYNDAFAKSDEDPRWALVVAAFSIDARLIALLESLEDIKKAIQKSSR